MEINVKISCPDLTLAASALAKAILDAQHGQAVTASTPAPVANLVNHTPAGSSPVTPVQTPQITIDQIGKAGADLLNKNPGAMPQLMGLLQKYGVQSAQQLKPDKIGAFATDLRAIGAVI